MRVLFVLGGLLLGGSALAADRAPAPRASSSAQPDLRISRSELERLHAEIQQLQRENETLRQGRTMPRSEARPTTQPPRAPQAPGAANAH